MKLYHPVLFRFVGGLVAEKYLMGATLVLLGMISICIMNVHVHDHVHNDHDDYVHNYHGHDDHDRHDDHDYDHHDRHDVDDDHG